MNKGWIERTTLFCVLFAILVSFRKTEAYIAHSICEIQGNDFTAPYQMEVDFQVASNELKK